MLGFDSSLLPFLVRHRIIMLSLRIKQPVPSTFLCFPFKSFISDWQYIERSGSEQSCSKYAQSFPLLGEKRILLGKGEQWTGKGKAYWQEDTLNFKKQVN